jgi:MFS family permease
MPDTSIGPPVAGAAAEAQRSLWRDADFMKLWSGQVISLMGSAFSGLAMALLAALTLGATPIQMGLLTAAGSAPSLLIGLFAGVWVDRYRRRPFLIAGDVGRALLLATIPIAALLGELSMVQLYAVSFLAGVLTVFFDVASQSYLPAIIDRRQLMEGNSKLGLSSSITAVAGPSLAGVVIQAITAPFAVVLDSLSFLASAGLVLLIRRREERPQVAPAPVFSGLSEGLREGLQMVIRDGRLRALAGCLATSNLASNVFFALYMLYGTRELGLNAAALGLVYGIGAIGAPLGAVCAPWAAARFGLGPTILGGAILGSLEVLPAVFATPRLAVPLLMLSSLIGNFGWVVHNVNSLSLRQAITPPALQGRVHATWHFLVTGMLPLGALAGGALGQALGLRPAIALAACGSALASLWVIFSPLPKLVGIPEAE